MALPPLVPNPAEHDWRSTWVVVAAWLIEQLEAAGGERFESGFQAVSAGLRNCDSKGRQAGATALFGDFTRRAIAAGVDRTRFVEWLGPLELLEARSGRVRGRVLYFKDAKGHGQLLGANRTVYFVHFSAFRGIGFRSEEAGQLVEFTPLYGTINDRQGWMARDVERLLEADGRERMSAG